MKKGFILIAALLLLLSIELVAQTTVYNFEFDIISSYPGQLRAWKNTVSNPNDWREIPLPDDGSFSGTAVIAHSEVVSFFEQPIYQVKVQAVNAIMASHNEVRAVYPGNNYFLIDLRIPFQEPEPDPQ